ncbi:hypothetical protein TVAG_191650 [Trichomonas vaginalis G3]|uniref:Uncharacterized protein n=1 Tax=Trichomonas vaginalis (strain ATCC PRA-98 / G3) TaxID=412133 RepID=A2EQM1_TRIV3|nr:hypothetical protein TVAGG3_0976840 [Trichomonas vaginalis G3]EAY05068.1 hypothetical protein TVAG_191650 [Trichomonas vaginalis G3]KAI5489000.1 hypothetical protein TVAGG3_0976840 [Trichomonas vaginalis G3]|eukprot:XP_001317291.1 hypothetical protein [Trichomonas vaginalis G3]
MILSSIQNNPTLNLTVPIEKKIKLSFGLEQKFETLNSLDKDLLVATQNLRLAKKLLETRKQHQSQNTKQYMKRIQDLSNEIKSDRKAYKLNKNNKLQEKESSLKNVRDEHHKLVGYIETQIERQIRYRKFEWLPDTDVFNDQIDALLDVLNYSREKLEKDKSSKVRTIGKVLSATQRTAESLKVELTAMDTKYRREIGELTKRIEQISQENEQINMKNANEEKRINEFQERRIAEEKSLCDELTNLYKSFVSTQNERLQVAKSKCEIMKRIAKETGDELINLKTQLEDLRKVVIPPTIERDHVDEIAIKAKMRVDKIILQHLKEENERLQRDYDISISGMKSDQ